MTRRRSISHHSVSTKHIPQRTCVSCRKIRDKQELIRLVRTTEGNVEVDPSGKKAGRGAYLCRARECWEIGLKGNRLEHALRSRLTSDNREQLISYAQEHLKGAN
ncbi:MAG: RNase P modulator RnpM [Dehalococcoidales bacterium]